MTKSLTEQWREGTLPRGAYYVNRLNEVRIYLITYEDDKNTHEIYEVIAPVPSYEGWKKLDDELMEIATKNDTVAMENGRLKKRLEIATKALKEYDNKLNWDIRGVSFMKYNKGFTLARKALKEMEGVK